MELHPKFAFTPCHQKAPPLAIVQGLIRAFSNPTLRNPDSKLDDWDQTAGTFLGYTIDRLHLFASAVLHSWMRFLAFGFCHLVWGSVPGHSKPAGFIQKIPHLLEMGINAVEQLRCTTLSDSLTDVDLFCFMFSRSVTQYDWPYAVQQEKSTYFSSKWNHVKPIFVYTWWYSSHSIWLWFMMLKMKPILYIHDDITQTKRAVLTLRLLPVYEFDETACPRRWLVPTGCVWK